MAGEDAKRLGDRGIQGRPTVSFRDFVAWLRHAHRVEGSENIERISPTDLFSWLEGTSVTSERLVLELSEFSGIPHVDQIESDDVEFKTLSRPFCEAKLVVPVRSSGNRQTVILSNPFDWEVLEDVERSIPRGRQLALLLAAPDTLKAVLDGGGDAVAGPQGLEGAGEPQGPEASDPFDVPEPRSRKEPKVYDPEQDPGGRHPVAKLVVELLSRSVEEGATHLILAPRGDGTVAKASIDGRPHDLEELSLETGKMAVARFKALSGMDLAKKRTPQNGRLEIRLSGEVIKLRLSTQPDSAFERLVVRILAPGSQAPSLEALGLSGRQSDVLKTLAEKNWGLVLVVGPPGSGKTTTIYSALAAVARDGRDVVTVEDPIEHSIPLARQLEVEPGADRRTLLQRAVDAKPDVLFLSEIRGLGSAQICGDYASSGHLVLTSLNSSNAATAVFRLDRLGLNRSNVADVLIGVVAQRLIKRLCPRCKELRPITKEERAMLDPFTVDPPATVAHPVGCSHCRGSGYMGRLGVFEVIPVGPRMADLIREGRPISELRDHAQARGDLLVGDHAIRKVREHALSVQDVYRKVLLEEGALVDEASAVASMEAALEVREESGATGDGGAGIDPGVFGDVEPDDLGSLMGQTTVLVVEDEEGTRLLLETILAKAGYNVLLAGDGGEALLMLGTGLVDLILSDIHMPNLDGIKLMEVLKQHEVDTPVVLLTGEPSPEYEARGREMGVADYLRKPVQRDVILNCIEKVLDGEEL